MEIIIHNDGNYNKDAPHSDSKDIEMEDIAKEPEVNRPPKSPQQDLTKQQQSLFDNTTSNSSFQHVTPTKQQTLLENIPSTSQVLTMAEKQKRDTISRMISPSTNGVGVPTPFKKVLFWPGTPPKKKNNTRTGTNLPAAVTSIAWQQYFEIKKKEKEEIEKKKQKRKAARESKAKNKKKVIRSPSTSSDSNEEEDISFADSDNETLAEIVQRYQEEEHEEENEEEDKELQIGKYSLN